MKDPMQILCLIFSKNPLTKLETGYTNRYGRLILGETELEELQEEMKEVFNS